MYVQRDVYFRIISKPLHLGSFGYKRSFRSNAVFEYFIMAFIEPLRTSLGKNLIKSRIIFIFFFFFAKRKKNEHHFITFRFNGLPRSAESIKTNVQISLKINCFNLLY
nr:hypothetical protein CJLB15_00042 [Campylobacter phage CJLB-15]